MDRAFLIGLTKELYRLTILFPKKEPLRYKLRELAINILAGPDDGDFEVLDRFFEVAKSQNWVRTSDILAIQSNYANLRGALQEPVIIPEAKDKQIFPQTMLGKSAVPRGDEPRPEASGRERNERQEKIIDFLKENEKAQVWEVKRIFPQISKRTLRRDFEFLLKQGAVQRIGERNNTFYQIKSI